MKTYTVTVARNGEFRTTYCNFRPTQNEEFIINGEKWLAVGWL